MVSVCFYFQVHQPDRIREYRIFDIGNSPFYLDQRRNELIMRKVANKCYLPMTRLLKKLIRETQGQFKCTFSFSGVFLEQAERYAPDVLESFQELVATGCVEILSETYYHSLSFLYSPDEWKQQVQKHRQKIQEIFGVTPQIFRNTELIYADWLGEEAAAMGYKAMLAEGVDWSLGWRSPNYLYSHPAKPDLKLLLKNYKLSDDIAFRFSNRTWKEWPLTTDKYVNWLDQAGLDGNFINLFMDFETFGEHQWDNTGIFEFMRYLPKKILERGHQDFITPSEAIQRFTTVGTYSTDTLTSWADQERDISAWKSNKMQEEALDKLYKLEAQVKATESPDLIDIWRRLTTSDHFYYMCTKHYSDGDVHKYFSPYDTPYDAYINFMNVLTDLTQRVSNYKGKPESAVKAETSMEKLLNLSVKPH